MKHLRIRPSWRKDAFFIAPRLRPMDLAEVEALGQEPLPVLLQGFTLSDFCMTGVLNGEPIGMFGVAPSGEVDVGVPWMLATPGVERCKIRLLRDSRVWIARMLERYPVLTNFVDARNATAIDWLEVMGFTFDKQPIGLGPESLPFFRFELRRD